MAPKRTMKSIGDDGIGHESMAKKTRGTGGRKITKAAGNDNPAQVKAAPPVEPAPVKNPNGIVSGRKIVEPAITEPAVIEAAAAVVEPASGENTSAVASRVKVGSGLKAVPAHKVGSVRQAARKTVSGRKVTAAAPASTGDTSTKKSDKKDTAAAPASGDDTSTKKPDKKPRKKQVNKPYKKGGRTEFGVPRLTVHRKEFPEIRPHGFYTTAWKDDEEKKCIQIINTEVKALKELRSTNGIKWSPRVKNQDWKDETEKACLKYEISCVRKIVKGLKADGKPDGGYTERLRQLTAKLAKVLAAELAAAKAAAKAATKLSSKAVPKSRKAKAAPKVKKGKSTPSK
ncbi:hypothetical protein VTL71DRAFT_2696 [Oculimacula yallundae]|uniref:Uncharacterized protein n=1 Tax=Oculimacula yallundae TaxID=86028 RepID=A0ABR4CA14_9HELO